MLERNDMPRQDPDKRRSNFGEVALGYSHEQALAEASRCIQCKKPSCVAGCPVGIDIPAFIQYMADDNMDAAIRELKSMNALPAICGRVCPQETQCEEICVLGNKGEPVAIGRLERYAADHEQDKIETEAVASAKATDKKVAVVGSGPAGLTAAAELAKMGHGVTLFEALHKAGGVLVYGIPEFRLPKSIVQSEVEYVESLGVDLQLNNVVGKLDTVDELLEEYDAVFLGTGAGLPVFMGIDGENLSGVYSANEFLTRVNLMKAYQFPGYDTPVKRGQRVVVVGGGNVAMDSARCAVRLGAEEVTIVYRRGEDEMPARNEEIENAQEEGVKFKLLSNPTRILGDESNWVTQLECLNMELCEPDESGRCRPVPLEGSQHLMDVNVVIIAIGTSPNPLIPMTTKGLETSKWGTIIADEDGLSSKEGVYGGGDVVTGAATVISAMGAGKTAAKAINKYLKRDK
ncbi:MAG: NADPH-dependent glutamate synthase [Methanosarcinales archaeon]|nr:NADPH-dependent glutamate synthase [Methanosarcinales archaeon]